MPPTTVNNTIPNSRRDPSLSYSFLDCFASVIQFCCFPQVIRRPHQVITLMGAAMTYDRPRSSSTPVHAPALHCCTPFLKIRILRFTPGVKSQGVRQPHQAPAPVKPRVTVNHDEEHRPSSAPVGPTALHFCTPFLKHMLRLC